MNSDPEADRINRLRDKHESLTLTEAEQTELALYRDEGKVAALGPSRAPVRRSVTLAIWRAVPLASVIGAVVVALAGLPWEYFGALVLVAFFCIPMGDVKK
jgi:hypothetical protein